MNKHLQLKPAAFFPAVHSIMKTLFLLKTLTAFAITLPFTAHADFTLRTTAGNGGINDINQAETLLASNSISAGTAPVINFFGFGGDGSVPGGVDFPNFLSGTDDFALEASGYVSGLAGPTLFNLGVGSDDGFRLHVNNTVPLEYIDQRPPGESLAFVTLNNGDFIRLTFFEHFGGEEVEFFVANVDGGNRQAVGSVASGITIGAAPASVPEPATIIAGLALCAIPAFGRRKRA